MFRPVLTLLLLSFLTCVAGLGRQAISDTDEGFYAEAAREMVESGDWLTPRFNYADRWQKPVLYYWMTAATYLLTGPTEFGARAWSAASGIGLTLLTWAIGRRLLRRDDTAWLAAAMVGTCYGYFAMARLALPDLPLAFFITLAIWMSIERRWALAGAAAGLGFLTKGPVAVVIPAIVILPIWWKERGRGPGVTARDVGVGAAVFALVGLPWYVAMAATHGSAYLHSFFLDDNLGRFASAQYNEPRSFLFYLPIAIGGMLPWSMYLLVLPWRRGLDLLRGRDVLTSEEWRLAIWAALPLFFYTLSVGKQPRYVLPVLPPLALLVAQSMTARIAMPRSGSSHRGLAAATWLTAAMFVMLAVLLHRARPMFITAFPTLTWCGIVALGASGVGLASVAATRVWRFLPGGLAASAVALLLTVQFGALAGLRPEPVEEMTALVRANRAAAERVGEYKVFVRNLVFYAGFKQEDLFDEAVALAFIKSPERVLLVVRARDLPRLESIAGVPLPTLGSVRYVDTANIKLRTLLEPLPQQDIDTVLLVANR